MAKLFQVYGVGQALFPVLPPPLAFENAPNSNQTNYEIGQMAYTPPKAPTAFYLYGGGGTWIQISDANGPVQSVLGTANQITVTTVAGVATVSLPSAIITPGSLTTTTTLAAGTTMTAGTGITSTTGNIVASAGNIIATLGNIAASAGSVSAGTTVSAGTSMTAGTTITATLGDITATAGNFVSSLAGKGLDFNANTATGAAASPVVLDSRAGQVIFTSVSIAAAADLTLTITNAEITGAGTQVIYSMAGATTGAALSIKSVTNSAGSSAIVVTNGTGATTTTADIALTFLVVN